MPQWQRYRLSRPGTLPGLRYNRRPCATPIFLTTGGSFCDFLRPARYGPPRLTKTTVNTKLTAALSLIEPAIMIFMDMFVAFLLIALYNARFYR